LEWDDVKIGRESWIVGQDNKFVWDSRVPPNHMFQAHDMVLRKLGSIGRPANGLMFVGTPGRVNASDGNHFSSLTYSFTFLINPSHVPSVRGMPPTDILGQCDIDRRGVI
jgi:hypothetical protein